VGTWLMEQIPPGGSPRVQGTIVIRQNGNSLAGAMDLAGVQVPLSNVNDNGAGIISFSAPLPWSQGTVPPPSTAASPGTKGAPGRPQLGAQPAPGDYVSRLLGQAPPSAGSAAA